MEANTFSHELEVACALARRAGAAALAHYEGGQVEVQYKGDDKANPVTQADRDANKIIVEGLAAAFPDDAILAEESPAMDARHSKTRLWCVDPVDGTREFIEHNGQFVVMIGLAIDGVARLGVLYQPTEDALLWGAGREGFIEQRGSKRRLAVSQERATDRAVLMISRSHRSKTVDRIATQLGFAKRLPIGSVGLKVAKLATGEADVYMSASNQTHEWDACAPEAVLHAAGGHMTDIGGKALVYNKPSTQTPHGILATNGLLHGACVSALMPVVQERGWSA